MRLDWIFLPRENPCAKFYIIIIIIIIINKEASPPIGSKYRSGRKGYWKSKTAKKKEQFPSSGVPFLFCYRHTTILATSINDCNVADKKHSNEIYRKRGGKITKVIYRKELEADFPGGIKANVSAMKRSNQKVF